MALAMLPPPINAIFGRGVAGAAVNGVEVLEAVIKN
jgi:hypothetical protein